MSEKKNPSPIRPVRTDRPSLLSPNCPDSRLPVPLSNLLSQGHEEDSCSRETVKFSPAFHEFGVDILTKDATTPVTAGTTALPPPPESPSVIVSSSSPLGVDSVDSAALEGIQEERVTTFSRRGGGSQRIPGKQKKSWHGRNMGIVIGDFNGLYPDELSIKVGEQIEIISKDTVVSRNIGWWTGRNKDGKIGIFPAACVSSDIHGNSGTGNVNSEYPLEIKNSEVEIKEVVGIGGFGKVYRAFYRGEEVAVKVAKMTTFDSLKAVQDVISEAEKFAHLAHVNVCALIGVVLVKDVCLVMEYARGGALSDVLHKSGISLPVDVITDWASQIATGMNYLHHEACPSLIHRDLKTNNILLANVVDPFNLKDNVIKITDFGLAREIEHTTHMSGAGTYPWMAPEVIRTSDFSKKSDVWSFAVILWELVTGERPYSGLNLFVVAFGVGQGTLSLPIPEGCPEPLVNIMNSCWRRDHVERPLFKDILADIKSLERSKFYTTTSHEEFRTMQSTWRGEIQKKFMELKKMEHELQRKEQILQERISEQEQKKKELEEKTREVCKKEEELDRLIRQLSVKKQDSKEEEEVDAFKKDSPRIELSVKKQGNKEEEEVDGFNKDSRRVEPRPAPWPTNQQPQINLQLVRPPRLRPFSIRKMIRRLWGNESGSGVRKIDQPLPNKAESIRAIRQFASSSSSDVSAKREKILLSLSDRHDTHLHGGNFYVNKAQGHKRRSSDEFRGGANNGFLSIDPVPDTLQRRGSVPSSPNHNRQSHQPFIAQHFFPSQGHTKKATPPNVVQATKSLNRETDKKSRQRSLSDLRSPSPNQFILPSYVSPMSKGVSSQPQHMTTNNTLTSSLPLAKKPTHLGFLTTKVSPQDSSSPGSPNVTITSAEYPFLTMTPAELAHPEFSHNLLYDSGKDSMTGSDASGHSNSSETQPDMIKLNSPLQITLMTSGKNDYIAEFDPITIRSSISHDSLLFESSQSPQAFHRKGSAECTTEAAGSGMRPTSATTSPRASSTSSSPGQSSVNAKASNCPSPNIVRPRPRPSKDFTAQTISAPSSGPSSPRQSMRTDGFKSFKRGTSSPTGSVQSMRGLFESDFVNLHTGLDSDTSTTSCNSLLGDLEEDLGHTVIHQDFDIFHTGYLVQQKDNVTHNIFVHQR